MAHKIFLPTLSKYWYYISLITPLEYQISCKTLITQGLPFRRTTPIFRGSRKQLIYILVLRQQALQSQIQSFLGPIMAVDYFFQAFQKL